ncbi:GntR family transcriptional regulator [Lactiplantibacillus herbarum]|uniref:GntR family transcriptional regulator n=1 Tax=Lactiplantibacillus herbarum TaxID=1670446 RepID=UPI00064FC464|nr:GntR family transcriptional regulator [Lactiplantibacillus herbarum]
MQIDHENGQPYYSQLVTGIKQDLAHGILQVGDQLPSVREMARQHLLKPNTVSKAYKQLEAEHVIRTVAGKGTYLNTVDPEAVQIEVRQQLQRVVDQAQQAGISVAELQEWLREMEEME